MRSIALDRNGATRRRATTVPVASSTSCSWPSAPHHRSLDPFLSALLRGDIGE